MRLLRLDDWVDHVEIGEWHHNNHQDCGTSTIRETTARCTWREVESSLRQTSWGIVTEFTMRLQYSRVQYFYKSQEIHRLYREGLHEPPTGKIDENGCLWAVERFRA
jgi:hypothetical protein